MTLNILVDINASIDYPEYDIPEMTNERTIKIIDDIQYKLEKLEKTFNNGKILKEGINLAIIGKPNAGKSSLLNTILKEDRAIVTDIEGTTRDTIEEFIQIDGIPFKIIDTAGIRNTEDSVEKIGINKSIETIKNADLVVAVLDASNNLSEEDEDILDIIKEKKAIILLNKIDKNIIINEKDIQTRAEDKPIIKVSVIQNKGIDKLYDKISEMYKLNEIEVDNSLTITNERHKEAIRNMQESAKNIKKSIETNMPIDVVSIHITEILENIGKITGDSVSEDIITEIFKKFCLGK